MTEPLRQPLPSATPDQSPRVRQRFASDPQSSVWVNASAGSGKTTVLTDRVARLLLDGVQPNKILCLTFTRAAAAEMSIRVTDKLSHWATCDDNELSQSLSELQGHAADVRQVTAARRLFARVIACPGGMRIRTIHAFCQEILRRFPIESSLSPHFTVMEEIDARALQEEVQADMLRIAADEPMSIIGKAFKSLVDNFSEDGFAKAMSGILSEAARVKVAIAEAGSLDQLIKQMRSELSLKPGDTIDAIKRFACTAVGADVRQAGQWLLEASKTYAPRGHKILDWLELALDERVAAFEGYCSGFFTQEGKPFDKIADVALLRKYPALEAIVRQEALRLQSVLEQLEVAQIAETTAAIILFGSDFIRRYEDQKIKRAVLDYDDLIVRTHELLTRADMAPWVMYKLDRGLTHILVDEAQDTSRAQWSIVQALADEFFAGSGSRDGEQRSLFVVGDEKQSIFSFQRADPEAFIAMRSYFAARITEADKQYREVPMQISFRSAPAILNAVDALFAQPLAFAGVSAEPIQHFSAPQQADRPEKVGRVELWNLQPAPKSIDDEDDWSPLAKYEAEQDQQAELAKQIATRIKSWMDSKMQLPGLGRAVVPGDIMILLRRRGRFADLMVRALKKCGVPVTGVDRMYLVKQLPVMDLLALMQFALLPEDDLNLASTLRGPLLNLSEDQLMTLAIGRKGTLWNSLSSYAEKDPAFEVARTYLAGWLDLADFITPFTFLARILNEACPGSEVSGRHAIWSRLGLDALDPTEELLNAAQNFSRRHAPSLQHFLHWLLATEAEIKRELEQGGNLENGGQVRIMTVHASKGLEAPVVFLPDTTSVPRSQDMPKFFWNAKEVPFYIGRTPNSATARRLWDTARQKQMEEYRRLLYVALTRAANQLYICGWENARSEGGAEQSWYQLALQGLQPLNEPSVQAEQSYLAIAFADPVLRKSEKPKPVKATATVKVVALPDWATELAPEEKTTSRPIAPSLIADNTPTATPDNILFARGRIIHRLLESLPDVTDTKREEVASRFLANPQHELAPAQQKEIQNEVLRLLRDPTYAPLFGPHSRAEVPMAGKLDGTDITGQVDRIYMTDNEIWIVDFKTNRPPPRNASAVPEAYRFQLAAYQGILTEIYPKRTIRCFLLWTYGPYLMELLPADLAS